MIYCGFKLFVGKKSGQAKQFFGTSKLIEGKGIKIIELVKGVVP